MVLNKISKLNEQELEAYIPFEASWHQEYKDTSYIYFGGFPRCTDFKFILTIFSQFGVPVKLKLARKKDGEFKGFGWLKYENWLSCVLAIDNLNGVPITVNVDEKSKKYNLKTYDKGNHLEGQQITRYIKVDHAFYKARFDEDGNEILDKYDREIEQELEKDFTDFQEKDNPNETNSEKLQLIEASKNNQNEHGKSKDTTNSGVELAW